MIYVTCKWLQQLGLQGTLIRIFPRGQVNVTLSESVATSSSSLLSFSLIKFLVKLGSRVPFFFKRSSRSSEVNFITNEIATIHLNRNVSIWVPKSVYHTTDWIWQSLIFLNFPLLSPSQIAPKFYSLEGQLGQGTKIQFRPKTILLVNPDWLLKVFHLSAEGVLKGQLSKQNGAQHLKE